jgi:flavin reductase (DIM6/NTAB) family NADH-FMN oxidoreductase RutF
MPAQVDPDQFRTACAQFATGITIATVMAPDGIPHGLTVSSFTSVSIDPPLILLCISYGCAPVHHFNQNSYFGINVLSDEQRNLSVIFSVKPEGRFDGVSWHTGAYGAPLIQGCLAHFECLTDRLIDAGDHRIVVGQVLRVESNPGQPLLYFNRSYRLLG